MSETANIDKLMLSLFNLHSLHCDLSDKDKNILKETYIEEGRKLYKEILNQNKDE